MSEACDRLFGQIAVRMGLVTQAQVDEVLCAQAAQGDAPAPLGILLVERGCLTAEQAAKVLREQQRVEAAKAGAARGPRRAVPAFAAPAAPRPLGGAPHDTVREEPAGGRTVPLAQERAGTAATSHTPRRPRPASETVEPINVSPPPEGEAASADSATPGPRRFGKYELVSELGRGGMGVVYKAYHPGLKSYFAVKVLLAGGDASAIEIDRFHREAEAAARLKHPGIVAVHDIGEEEGKTYFAMEYVEGKSLDKVLDDPHAVGIAPAPLPRSSARRAPAAGGGSRSRAWGLSPAVAVRMTQDIAEALQCAHEAGVVHRDLKPANVIRDRAGRLKVMDFGLAKLVDTAAKSGATRTGAVMGTPAYMSPEQAEGRVKEVDAVSDVYQLGTILYELLTGRPPYEGETAMDILLKVMQEDPPPLRRLNPRIPRDVETICHKCLERHRARRYSSAAALAADLGRFLAGDPIEARPMPTAERLWRKAVKYRRVLAPFAAVVLVAGGLGLYGLYAQAARTKAETGERDAQAGKTMAEAGERARAAEVEAERILVRAEGLWHNAKLVLYQPDVPLARYHERLAEAMKVYAQAAQACPSYGWIYESRGRVEIQTTDLRQAEVDLKKAIELPGPQRKAARRSLGRVYLERSLDTIYMENTDERSFHDEGIGEWGGKAIDELKASAGQIEWRGTAEEEQLARALGEAMCAWAAGDPQHARERLLRDFGRSPDEELAWGLSIVVADASEKDQWREKALRLRPRFGRALLDRGAARHHRGDLDGAIADNNRVIELHPRSALAYNNRGNVLLTVRDLDGAMADFSRAIELDPERAMPYGNRSNVRRERGDLDGAIADCNRAIELDPRPAGAYCDRSWCLLARGDLDGAIADCNRAFERSPEYAGAYLTRGNIRQTMGNLDGAIADFTRAVEIEPNVNRDRAYLNRGNARTAKGDLDAAIADYDHAIEINPRLAPAYCHRGAARQAKGDLDGAIVDCNRAIEIEPQLAEGYCDRGLARQAKGDLNGAIADHTHAIELDPKLPNAYAGRGWAKQCKGDMDEAIADYNRAIQIDPKFATAYNNRGWVRQCKGDLDEAIADYTRAIESDAKYHQAYINRAIARKAKGDLDGAIADNDRALEIDSLHATTYVNRGSARQDKGDLDGAIADYDRAIEIDPKLAEAYANRGLAHQAKGDRRGAVEDLRKALEVAPIDWPHRKALEDRLRSVGQSAPSAWVALASRASRSVAAGDYGAALSLYEQALASAPKDDPGDPASRAALLDAHYNLACILALAAAGREGPKSAPKAVAPDQVGRLRDKAFGHLEAAIRLGWSDRAHLEADADLEPLHADPRWVELLKRLKK